MNKENLANLPVDLLNSSVDLDALGLSVVAWHRPYALKVLEWCRNQNYIILGGDVYLLEKNLEYAYADWAIEIPSSNENLRLLVSSSYGKAYEYITQYKELIDAQTLYSITVSSLNEAMIYSHMQT